MTIDSMDVIDSAAGVAHAHELNTASRAHRDFTLINLDATGRIISRGRMLYSADITYSFDSNGGFYAAYLAAEEIEYAYPTSDHAIHARKRPVETAMKMLQPVWDYVEFYRSRPWHAERFTRMSAQMSACEDAKNG